MAVHKKAQAEREASVVWQGDLLSGSGTIDTVTSGAFGGLPVSWASRTEEANGQTSPEELLAAAHAACFSMALSHELTGRGSDPERLEVSARVGFDPKVGGGFEVSFSRLTVRGQVPGMDMAVFEQAAHEASEGCPISQALKGNVEITVLPTLA
jgi:osmotically inducible protein OsmC